MNHRDNDIDSQQFQGQTLPTTRKRNRVLDETDGAKDKREKARERQRRKRERDRVPTTPGGYNQEAQQEAISSMGIDMDMEETPEPTPLSGGTPKSSSSSKETNMSPEEISRREKVRIAARDRQRKHRALVKAKRMAELGLSMDNLLPQGINVGQTYITADGTHIQTADQHHQLFAQPAQHLTGGQTFASTLLLSFSCAPLLKQHLLRNLNMTNEELASFEPVIAAAWNHWDAERQRHYATVAAAQQQQRGVGSPNGSPYPVDEGQPAGQHPNPYPLEETPNDYRERFHQQLTAPSPFRAQAAAAAPDQHKIHPGQEGIDPMLQSAQTSDMRLRPVDKGETDSDEEVDEMQ